VPRRPCWRPAELLGVGVEVFAGLPGKSGVESVAHEAGRLAPAACRVADPVSVEVVPDRPGGLADKSARGRRDDVDDDRHGPAPPGKRSAPMVGQLRPGWQDPRIPTSSTRCSAQASFAALGSAPRPAAPPARSSSAPGFRSAAGPTCRSRRACGGTSGRPSCATHAVAQPPCGSHRSPVRSCRLHERALQYGPGRNSLQVLFGQGPSGWRQELQTEPHHLSVTFAGTAQQCGTTLGAPLRAGPPADRDPEAALARARLVQGDVWPRRAPHPGRAARGCGGLVPGPPTSGPAPVGLTAARTARPALRRPGPRRADEGQRQFSGPW
jgi:hypothetical protein